MGFEKHSQLAKSTLHFGFPLKFNQGTRFEMIMNDTPKNSFQIDGEVFKHLGGKAKITIEFKSQINLLRYE